MKRLEVKIIAMFIGLCLCGFTPAAQPAEWTVEPTQYQNTMSVTAVLNIEGEISTDVNDAVAIFAGSECRGVAKSDFLDPNGNSYLLLTVYSNVSNEELDIKVYDASAGKVYDIKQKLSFVKDDRLGSFDKPVTFFTDLTLKELKTFNFFTPNGDGFNDYFEVDDPFTVSSLTFKVYTANGVEVYSQKDYNNLWQGVDKNGKELPKGSYYYIFIDDSKKVIYKGSITLVR